MTNWLNRQSYFVIALIVTAFFAITILLFALSAGASFKDALFLSSGLGALSSAGFLLVKYTMPDKSKPAGVRSNVVDLDQSRR